MRSKSFLPNGKAFRFALTACAVLLCLSFRMERSSAAASDPGRLSMEEIERYVQKCDLLKSRKQLIKYSHRDMTSWGSVEGYWNRNDLAIIETAYHAELGYTSQTVYWMEGKVCRIVLKAHTANWSEYERDHGEEEFDASKVTFTDTYRDHTFGKGLVSSMLNGKEMIPFAAGGEEISAMLEDAGRMRRFLEEASSK